MSNKPQAAPLSTPRRDHDFSDVDSPTIVLDVATLEDAPQPAAPRSDAERSRLPDELLGMYYHG